MTKKPPLMSKVFRLCVAQLNPIIGDVAGNLAKARVALHHAAEMKTDLIIFPAHFISGSPLHDLARNPAFIARCQQAIDALQCEADAGEMAILLPQNLDALPEEAIPFVLKYDMEPYQRGRPEQRLQAAQAKIKGLNRPLIQVNAFGGQDGLVFDGGSFALQSDGSMAFQMPHFAESVSVSVWEQDASGWWCREGENHAIYQGAAADYQACMMGLRDYVDKNGFASVILGLSGGVDSALVAALAADALGADRLRTVMLPYRYTSAASLSDAEECARLLGSNHQMIPIAAPVEGFMSALAPAFEGQERDVTEENLQARARGTLLMALSNKFGALLLTTGNKSEGAVGYATLYGDMCGGFNPIKDLYKQHVYALCNWRNQNHPAGALGPQGVVIPQNIIDKAPSAELRDGQRDEDSLPPYPILDEILDGLIEQQMSAEQIVAGAGGHYEREVVERVEQLLYSAEYKRRQSAPGIKISARSFDHDWHMPIAHRFRDK